MTRRLLLPVAVLVALTAAPAAAEAAPCAKTVKPGGEWPTFGRNLANSRYQEREKVISPADAPLLRPAWTFSTAKAGGEGDIAGTPLVSRGCLYAATSRGWVFALNADTGAVVWKARIPYGGGVTGSVGLARVRVPVQKAKRKRCASRRKKARPRGKARGSARKRAKRRCARKRAKKRARRRARRRNRETPAKPKRGRRKRSCARARRRAAGRRGKRGRKGKARAKARRKACRKRARRRTRVVNVVYVAASRTQKAQGCPKGDPCIGPYVVALNRANGKRLWATRPIDTQAGADVYGSPILFRGTLMIGVSGGSAELGDEADRYAFQGSMNFLDARNGRVLRKTWTIHPPNRPNDRFAGAGVWSTPAVDPQEKVAYVGTANPFKPQAEHRYSNAVVKYDVDRRSPRFGRIIGSYKGDIDEYVPGLSKLPCYDFPGNNPPFYPQGIGACGDIDLDFGASPNLFRGPGGRKLVGAGQKSGVYHVFDAKTMKPVWKQIVGPPTPLGGIVGSTAYDGRSVYGPITVPGYTWALSSANGSHRWFGPVADGAHWGPPVAVANGVVYTVDLAGHLNAYDARTGAPLLKRPMALGGSGPVSLSWGGVAVARQTVYAGVGLGSLSEGFIVAFRPGRVHDAPNDVQDTLGGIGGGGPGGEVPAGSAILAGPGATSTGYATPVMATQKGGPLSFVNLDPVQHDVVSVQRGPDGRPLFASKLSGLGEVSPVKGLDRVNSGQTYPFICSIHPGMRGSLVVR